MSESDASEPQLSDAVYKALEKGLTVEFRIVRRTHLDYSIVGRPLPQELNDHLLATAIIEAGHLFPQTRTTKKTLDATVRDDGRVIKYKHAIRMDWKARTIRSSANQELTLKVLSIVVQDLMKAAYADHARSGGLN